ncbi:Major capsid protein [Tetrabaena socialis]|uniref:Major capsid protein n=1 Tax=Tetrabaena socialis TaxID=47790 RepID=A0A2J7ZM13_9CHLO|nr:Major capsid protein [Tetrabaena socialis]|eukprot:PNH01290.1 Major capsid protein [Tetrabaena socialis]
MGGGLMQLVAYGAQDIYLTGNPQITFFKVVYRRHTNFAMESIEQVFNGSGDFNKKVTCTISRNGDLIHRTYLQVQLPDVTLTGDTKFRWVNWVGHALIKSVELEIGGQRIDKHYGDWLHIWSELTQTAGHQLGYANMVGNTPNLTTMQTNVTGSSTTIKGDILYIPLEFFFCRNPGLALPLIALQYHEVKINLELADVKNLYWAAKKNSSNVWVADSTAAQVGPLVKACLYVDYVYLDTDERRRFAQVSHEYLIEQLQFTGDESTSTVNNKIKMNFNHPTKELIWVVQPDANVVTVAAGSSSTPCGPQWFNYTDDLDPSQSDEAFVYSDAATAAQGGMPGCAAGGANGVFIPTSFEGGDNPVSTASIALNGHDRMAIRDGRYFNLVQPYQHHENVPSKGIYVYSFGLRPEEHQPSGTCNFSRIDNATLNLNLTSKTVFSSGARTAKIRVYAVNYNVLRIMSGMGGLAYSN